MDASQSQSQSQEGSPALAIENREPRLGWKALLIALTGYLVLLALGVHAQGSWNLRTQLPASPLDPLQHLWLMRWYKACLLEGRLPWLCLEIEYPVGSPLGNFSPLHLQSLLYILLSTFSSNDILIYNIMWVLGFVFTGLGTYVLAFHLTKDRGCSFFAGLAVMLSGAMMARGVGHLELLYLGSFPLFMTAWMRFVDSPTRRRMLLAAGGFLLVTMSAAYYMVFAIFPATLYVIWTWVRAIRLGEKGWLLARLRLFSGFIAVVLPVLLVLFSGNIWAESHKFQPMRSDDIFRRVFTPLSGYIFPEGDQFFEPFFPLNPYRDANYLKGFLPQHTYLGLATLVLLWYGASRRVKFAHRAFWWTVLAVLGILSMGSSVTIGGHVIPLPAVALRKYFLPFRLLREVGRFHMFATVVAGLLASVALHHWLSRFHRRWVRVALLSGVLAFTLVDLSRTFWGTDVPGVPACYAAIIKGDPEATFYEVYQPDRWSAVGWYQTHHRRPSTVSVSGLTNPRFLSRDVFNYPIKPDWSENPDFLANGDVWNFNNMFEAHFRDYLWLFMKSRNLRYLVVHKQTWDGPWNAPGVARAEALIQQAKVYEDGDTAVYALDRLPKPEHPVMALDEGWAGGWYDCSLYWVSEGQSRLMLYNPDPSRPVRLTFRARSNGHARQVRLIEGKTGRELADWQVGASKPEAIETPALCLPQGLVALRLEGGANEPNPVQIDDVRPGPFALSVSELKLQPRPEQVASQPGEDVQR